MARGILGQSRLCWTGQQASSEWRNGSSGGRYAHVTGQCVSHLGDIGGGPGCPLSLYPLTLCSHTQERCMVSKRGTKVVAACLREAPGALSLKAEEWAVLRHWLQKGKRLSLSRGRGVKRQGAGYREHMGHLLTSDLQLAPTCCTPNCWTHTKALTVLRKHPKGMVLPRILSLRLAWATL